MPPELVELEGVGFEIADMRVLCPPEICHPVCLQEVCLVVLIWEWLPQPFKGGKKKKKKALKLS